MGDRTRDPRLQLPMLVDNPAFVGDPDRQTNVPMAELQELRDSNAALKTALDHLTGLVSSALAGRKPAGEVLAADPANPYPRPLTHRSLTLPDTDWAPLVPLEGVHLFQAVMARAGSAKSLGSVVHELPFLYSMLSYAHDALHNLRACQEQIQEGTYPEEAYQASLDLLDKVVKLGGKRFTEIQVMVDHDVPTASLLHLQNFGPAGAAGVMDAGDRLLLLDIRKQEIKEQKKSVLKTKPSRSGGSGRKGKPGNGGAAAPAAPRAS